MLPFSGRPARFCSGPSRREFLRVGGITVGGLSLPRLLANGRRQPAGGAKAKNCLLIFMDGGPSHLELWDLKPDAPAEIRGEFKPIRSQRPRPDRRRTVAARPREQMHHLAQVRSVHHGINDHNAGSYYMLTGRVPGGRLEAHPDRLRDHLPALRPGARRRNARPRGRCPPYVLLPEFQWNNGVDIGGQKAGFLGAATTPSSAATRACPATPCPASIYSPKCRSTASPARTTSASARPRRRPAAHDAAAVARMGVFQKKALEIISSPETRGPSTSPRNRPSSASAIGMDPGSDRSIEARKFGGLPHIGQTFLLARRLIEAGVRLVTV